MSELLVVGGKEDAVLVSQAVHDAVRALVGDDDPLLLVEEHTADVDDDDPDSSPAADAARTLPFLTDRRIVVVREVQAYTKEGLRPLLAYLEDPSPTTELVLSSSGAPAKALRDAVKAAGGEVRDVSAPRSQKGVDSWFAKHMKDSPVRLAPAARAAVEKHLGQDLGRLEGLLDSLAAAYGRGTQLGVEQVTPYLGSEGGVPPWALTDAIDGGRTSDALSTLHRLLGPSGSAMHPLQVLGVLTNHYRRVLRLDGSGITNEKDAAVAVGITGKASTYPAQKALTTARRIGHDGLVRAIDLLAQADLDLKGRSGLDDRTVLEVLVARLSRLARAG